MTPSRLAIPGPWFMAVPSLNRAILDLAGLGFDFKKAFAPAGKDRQ